MIVFASTIQSTIFFPINKSKNKKETQNDSRKLIHPMEGNYMLSFFNLPSKYILDIYSTF